MERSWYARLAIVLGAIVVGWLAVWPSLERPAEALGQDWLRAPEWVQETFEGRIQAGLDMQGGLRLAYEVEVDEYIRDQRDRRARDLMRRLGVLLEVYDDVEEATDEELREVAERVQVLRPRRSPDAIRVEFTDADDAALMTHDWRTENGFDAFRVDNLNSTDTVIILLLKEAVVSDWRDNAVQQAVHTISQRIDALGLAQASVIGRETDIIVEVPGAGEAQFERIRSIISRTASLEFKIVDESGLGDLVPAGATLPEGLERIAAPGPRGSGQSVWVRAYGADARQRLEAWSETVTVPGNRTIALGEDSGAPPREAEDGTVETAWRVWYLEHPSDVTGEDLEDAFVSQDPQTYEIVVSFRMKARGATEMAELTGAHVGERMAVVLDDIVESAPVINSRIAANGQITLGGGGSAAQQQNEANELRLVLKAGALPAPLRPANEQLIGPSLGEDSVRLGAKGALLGIGIVLVFMLIYYQVAGIVADLMVVLNLLLQLAIMAALEATLTLPGIAAMALTVGMAVDAHVLIVERIREELRTGRSPRSGVDQGFSRAFWSIVDSQITTFLAGVVLFQFGTGPIKGFAVMLMIGIVTSLFTGIFCSKVLFDGVVRGLKVERLRVG